MQENRRGRYVFAPSGHTMGIRRYTTLKHQTQKADKWLKFKDFFNTQRIALLMGCCLLIIGAVVYVATSPSKEQANEPVQKQQSPTLEQTMRDPLQTSKAPDAAQNAAEQAQDGQAQGEQTQSDKPAEQAQSTPSAAETAKQTPPKLQMPVEGEVIRAFSGETLVYNKALNAWSTHNGVDISAAEGAPVGAALAGEVTSVKMDSTRGWVVALSHTDGQTTLYAGLSDACVQEGDKVNAGQQLGTAGIPPFESDLGAHLHFEYQKNGKYLDPMEHMAAK